MSEKKVIKGGSFLLDSFFPDDIFTPEDITEEHRMIADTTKNFIEKEVVPNIQDIEHKKEGLTVALLKKSGELGLLGVDVPEKYEGMGLDKVSSTLVAEITSKGGSFGVSFGANVGIGTLPIVYFGNEEQKKKYLPRLASGEMLAAYALTEANSGSDALNAKTKAVLSEDGKYYILNGEKMFITNAGFADVIIVFAKIDGEKFTAFIVEKTFPGVSVGPEEKKLGLKGSSTTTVILEDARVPVENVLGEIGKGHKIAFNILNIGRFKLGAGAIGAAKVAIDEAVKYALVRQQFGKPIAQFGMIKHKIGEMAIKAFVGESMTYRTIGLINDALHDIDPDATEEILKGIEEYAIECSMIKVYCSEILDYVVDEAVQIFGGYGYIEDYNVERFYRDSRINRIFEGTNEINRMLVPGMFLKKAMKGQLPFMAAVKKLMDEILGFSSLEEEEEALFSQEQKLVTNAKKIALLAVGAAAQKYMATIADQQEVLSYCSDIIMETYAMESVLLRTMKIINKQGQGKAKIYIDITKTFINDAIGRVELGARQVLAAISQGDELRTQLSALKRFTRYIPINTIEKRQAIANKLYEVGRYFI